jgi:hypothetical protein
MTEELHKKPEQQAETIAEDLTELVVQSTWVRPDEAPEVLRLASPNSSSPWLAEILAIHRADPHWKAIALGMLDTPERGELAPLTSGALQVVFDQLAEQWREETKGTSLPARREMHFAYQQIIGMGEPAVPLILEALADEVDDWFWALIAITRVDIAEGASDVHEAATRWLSWGRETGHITESTSVGS